MESSSSQLPGSSSTASSKYSWVIEGLRAVGGFVAIILLGLSGALSGDAIERCIWVVSVGQGLPSLLTAGKTIVTRKAE